MILGGKKCRVRKLFRFDVSLDSMVKLSDKKIRWMIIRHVGKDMTTRQAADIYNISIRRVQQL
ncbi:MAG TPA: hypothetical protein EYP23_02770, partial [Thermoplasmata archaeon]|nr:hypothetical protein [Thermoplasmata archaeon]